MYACLCLYNLVWVGVSYMCAWVCISLFLSLYKKSCMKRVLNSSVNLKIVELWTQ